MRKASSSLHLTTYCRLRDGTGDLGRLKKAQDQISFQPQTWICNGIAEGRWCTCHCFLIKRRQGTRRT